MEDNLKIFYSLNIVMGLSLVALIIITQFASRDIIIKKIDTIKLQDQCELIHGMKTVKARKFNPKHNRELKRVVLTCGEGQ